MNRIFNALMIILFVSCLVSCTKNDREYMGEGVITGFDPRDCACCGGLLINLNSASTELFTDSTYQVDLVPADLVIDANTVFPIFISLDYSRNNKLCGKTIDILRFDMR